MRHLRDLTLVVVLTGFALLAGPAGAADKIRVVATTTDLKALAEAVGGDLVEVDALARTRMISRCARASWSRCARPTSLW